MGIVWAIKSVVRGADLRSRCKTALFRGRTCLLNVTRRFNEKSVALPSSINVPRRPSLRDTMPAGTLLSLQQIFVALRAGEPPGPALPAEQAVKPTPGLVATQARRLLLDVSYRAKVGFLR